MRTRMRYALGLFFAGGVGFASVASAQLYSRLNGTMVYDSDQNITWLADANYAATVFETSCGREGVADGTLSNPAATVWVKSLKFGGYADWRLPKTVTADPVDPTCSVQSPSGSSGFNCVGGEMGHLFYKGLGGKAGHRLTQWHNGDSRLFKNLQNGTYWTGTDFAAVPQIGMNFHTSDGAQVANSKSVKLLAWPVRDGDIGNGLPGYQYPHWENNAQWAVWKSAAKKQAGCN